VRGAERDRHRDTRWRGQEKERASKRERHSERETERKRNRVRARGGDIYSLFLSVSLSLIQMEKRWGRRGGDVDNS